MTTSIEPMSNPYVGPRTFTEEQRHLFFGREREASELFARVLSERLVLFYAQSGAGKSSLINTRLIPRLREIGYGILPVARVSGELPAGVSKIDNVFQFNLMLSLDSSGRDPGRFAQMDLSHFLARLGSEDGKRFLYEETAATEQQVETPPESAPPYVLIIDQFEELITSHQGHWQKREDFFRQLNQAMVEDPRLWVVLSFREDYLAPIEPFAAMMADRMRARFYMERMGDAAALEAVRRPAELAGRPFASGAAEQLVEDLRQVRVSGQETKVAGPYVEPVQLQVVCHQLWKNIEVEGRPPGQITLDDVKKAGDVNKALINFYEEVLASTLRDFAEQITERRLRTWFEQELITPDGTRGLVRQGEEATGDLANSVVAAIQKRFLLRSDTRSGDTRIELVHDRFVEPILASNRQWRTQNQNPLVLAAEVWLAEDRSPRRLLYGAQLRSAETQLDAARHELTEDERSKIMALLEASEQEQQQRIELLQAQRTALLEPKKFISEMGWGIIFPAIASTDPEYEKKRSAVDAIQDALRPLLEHRQAEATMKHSGYYREFIHDKGYRPGEDADRFLARQGVGPGKTDPSQVPYYLLLVGDPESMPFEFQYQLDVSYAVGRIHFETIDDYRQYAESVVQAETGPVTRPPRAVFFAPTHEDDPVTRQNLNLLIRPLIERLKTDKPDWSLISFLEQAATKARLGQLFSGVGTPALAFVACHGIRFPPGDPRQATDQGGLVCEDWRLGRKLSPDLYFSAGDLPENANLMGLIAFVFADYGAGTPREDQFSRLKRIQLGQQPGPTVQLSAQPFVASLPQRMLSAPVGGALAVVGHVERCWPSSFLWKADASGHIRPQITAFESALKRLMEGYPVGSALEPFNERYAQLAAMLGTYLEAIAFDDPYNRLEFANVLMATIDARNWIVIGDPAVRLMVSGLRPDMAGLKLFYDVERLRKEGDSLARQGLLSEAEAHYQRVLQRNPVLVIDSAREARSVRARALLREASERAAQGEAEEAIAKYDEAERLDPDLNLEAINEVLLLVAPHYLAQGREAARAGDYETARELLNRAADYDPALGVDVDAEAKAGVAQFHFDQGGSLAKAGHVDQAIAHYAKAREFAPALPSDFDATEPLDPTTEAGRYAVYYYLEQGEEQARAGNLEEATAAFRRAAELNPLLMNQWAPEERAAERVKWHHIEKERALRHRAPVEKRAMTATPADDQLLWFNGVNAATGEYATPPLTAEELVRLVRGETSWDSLKQQAEQRRLATSSGDSSLEHL